MIKRNETQADNGDATAIFSLGQFYANGEYGCPQDYDKALEFYHRAARLGYTDAYYNIVVVYAHIQAVEVEAKKVRHYWELAAMGGHTGARYYVGCMEEKAGNYDRAIKHYDCCEGWGF